MIPTTRKSVGLFFFLSFFPLVPSHPLFRKNNNRKYQHHTTNKQNKAKRTDGNNGDGGTLVASSDSQEPTVRGMAEQLGKDFFGRGGGVDTIKGAGEDNGTGRVSDCDDPVGKLSALDSDVAIH